MLDKMIAALGGQAYLTYKTRTDSGRSYGFYKGDPNSIGTPFWRFYKYPDKDRIELTKNETSCRSSSETKDTKRRSKARRDGTGAIGRLPAQTARILSR